MMVVYKLSPNEEERVLREERNKRRLLRIKEVREQAKAQSAKIRSAVQSEKLKFTNSYLELFKRKWQKEHEDEVKKLEENLKISLLEIGQSHRNAEELNNQCLDEKKRSEDVENKKLAIKRNKLAIETLAELNDEKSNKANQQILNRWMALDREKSRSKKIISRPKKPPEIIDVLDLKALCEAEKNPILENLIAVTKENPAQDLAHQTESWYHKIEAEKKEIIRQRKERALKRYKDAMELNRKQMKDGEASEEDGVEDYDPYKKESYDDEGNRKIYDVVDVKKDNTDELEPYKDHRIKPLIKPLLDSQSKMLTTLSKIVELDENEEVEITADKIISKGNTKTTNDVDDDVVDAVLGATTVIAGFETSTSTIADDINDNIPNVGDNVAIGMSSKSTTTSLTVDFQSATTSQQQPQPSSQQPTSQQQQLPTFQQQPPSEQPISQSQITSQQQQPTSQQQQLVPTPQQTTTTATTATKQQTIPSEQLSRLHDKINQQRENWLSSLSSSTAIQQTQQQPQQRPSQQLQQNQSVNEAIQTSFTINVTPDRKLTTAFETLSSSGMSSDNSYIPSFKSLPSREASSTTDSMLDTAGDMESLLSSHLTSLSSTQSSISTDYKDDNNDDDDDSLNDVLLIEKQKLELINLLMQIEEQKRLLENQVDMDSRDDGGSEYIIQDVKPSQPIIDHITSSQQPIKSTCQLANQMTIPLFIPDNDTIISSNLSIFNHDAPSLDQSLVAKNQINQSSSNQQDTQPIISSFETTSTQYMDLPDATYIKDGNCIKSNNTNATSFSKSGSTAYLELPNNNNELMKNDDGSKTKVAKTLDEGSNIIISSSIDSFLKHEASFSNLKDDSSSTGSSLISASKIDTIKYNNKLINANNNLVDKNSCSDDNVIGDFDNGVGLGSDHIWQKLKLEMNSSDERFLNLTHPSTLSSNTSNKMINNNNSATNEYEGFNNGIIKNIVDNNNNSVISENMVGDSFSTTSQDSLSKEISERMNKILESMRKDCEEINGSENNQKQSNYISACQRNQLTSKTIHSSNNNNNKTNKLYKSINEGEGCSYLEPSFLSLEFQNPDAESSRINTTTTNDNEEHIISSSSSSNQLLQQQFKTFNSSLMIDSTASDSKLGGNREPGDVTGDYTYSSDNSSTSNVNFNNNNNNNNNSNLSNESSTKSNNNIANLINSFDDKSKFHVSMSNTTLQSTLNNWMDILKPYKRTTAIDDKADDMKENDFISRKYNKKSYKSRDINLSLSSSSSSISISELLNTQGEITGILEEPDITLVSGDSTLSSASEILKDIQTKATTCMFDANKTSASLLSFEKHESSALGESGSSFLSFGSSIQEPSKPTAWTVNEEVLGNLKLTISSWKGSKTHSTLNKNNNEQAEKNSKKNVKHKKMFVKKN